MKVANRVAAQPPGALRANKSLMMQGVKQELMEANERELQTLKERARAQEPREAIAAFENEQKQRRGAQTPKL